MLMQVLKGVAVGVLALAGIIVLLPLVLMLMLWILYAGVGAVQSIPFDVQTQGVVEVIVQDHHDDDDTLWYYSISAHGQAQKTEPFEPEEMVVHRICPDSLESYVDREKNKVLNRLQEVCVYDAKGQRVENEDPLIDRVMQQAAKLEHDIMELCIMEAGGHVFLHTELNVNLWCPYELYYYDPVKDRLIELYTFDGLEVIGLRVRNMELLVP